MYKDGTKVSKITKISWWPILVQRLRFLLLKAKKYSIRYIHNNVTFYSVESPNSLPHRFIAQVTKTKDKTYIFIKISHRCYNFHNNCIVFWFSPWFRKLRESHNFLPTSNHHHYSPLFFYNDPLSFTKYFPLRWLRKDI